MHGPYLSLPVTEVQKKKKKKSVQTGSIKFIVNLIILPSNAYLVSETSN